MFCVIQASWQKTIWNRFFPICWHKSHCQHKDGELDSPDHRSIRPFMAVIQLFPICEIRFFFAFFFQRHFLHVFFFSSDTISVYSVYALHDIRYGRWQYIVLFICFFFLFHIKFVKINKTAEIIEITTTTSKKKNKQTILEVPTPLPHTIHQIISIVLRIAGFIVCPFFFFFLLRVLCVPFLSLFNIFSPTFRRLS